MTPPRSPWTLATLALCACAVAVGITFGSRVASGADSYGYVSQAYRWVAGDITLEQGWVADAPWPAADWTFSPLGWRPARHLAPGTIVPSYAAGLPLLMAIGILIAGPLAPFTIGWIAAVVLLWTTYRLGRALASPFVGAAASWLLLTSPVFLYSLVLPMSDLPATAAWMGAAILVLPRGGRRPFAAGVLVTVALLIRPNLMLLALPLAALCLLPATDDGSSGSRWWRRLAWFGAGSAPGPVLVAMLNNYLYGHPLLSGYGGASYLYDWARAWPNLLAYGRWVLETQPTAVGLGLIALCLPIPYLWPRVQPRIGVVLLGAIPVLALVSYLPYLSFDSWTFLRFLLPGWPVVLLGAAAAFGAVTERYSGDTRTAAMVVLVTLGLVQVRTSTDLGVFDLWRQEQRYQTVGQAIRPVLPANAVVLTAQHSGSVRFYAGHMTIRQDVIDPGSLDTVVTWLHDQGVSAYLLLEEWEEPAYRATFAGQRYAALDGWHPIFVYHGTTTARLYDLARPMELISPFTVRETFVRPAATGPRPLPVLPSQPR